jgi:spermidine synthase
MNIIVNKEVDRVLRAQQRAALYGLFFLSGIAALAYQVIWARQLSFIFGSTAQAAALVIAIFFTGIALGSRFWGARTGERPLSTFGWLEIGVAVTALGHFALFGIYRAVYPTMYSWADGDIAIDVLARMLIATTVLLPASFLMGGTLPAMAQVMADQDLAKSGAALYAMNTLGGATGAFAAGFIFPPIFGFTITYLIAVSIDLLVGVIAVRRGRRLTWTPRLRSASTARDGPPSPLMWVIAGVSGAATLGIEIVWTRLFSQVLQNSAYTYAIVLSTFLIALACGALIARMLADRFHSHAQAILAALLILSAAVAVTSPWIFRWATDDVSSIGDQSDFFGYVFAVLSVAGIVIVIPGAILGAVLPFLLRFIQSEQRTAGHTIGQLVLVNTIGAIVGALATGFVLLPRLGTWRTLVVIAFAYCLLVIALAVRRHAPVAMGAVAIAAAIGLVIWVPPTAHTVRLFNVDEQLIAVREGTQATVTVVGQGANRAIRVNNNYTLGGSRSQDSERTQSVLPLALHGQADSVFALGLGTGITAGGALTYPIDRLLVCELIEDVVDLAREHFTPWINGLFTDDRAQIMADDGRICLSRSTETFDVIVSDLFTPWQAGTGNLYTAEHFSTVRERLNPDGLFVQWIPLYQVSEKEFGSLARTMAETFDQVTVWRGDFFASRSIVALVGHTNHHPLDPTGFALGPGDSGLGSDDRQAALLRMYIGNLEHSAAFANAPINTDASAFIEYSAPRTQRAVRAGKQQFLTGSAREALYDQLAGYPTDPFLRRLTPAQQGYVNAGRDLSRALLLADRGRSTGAAEARERHDAQVPESIRERTSLAQVLIGHP